ncbi:MAG TPA: hypothetical protein VE172_10980 [Stackebrandtia sp.]|jgi:phenylacetate-coenzyme A ligase PaaK-like adenylate-forming protein|uniref:hypothetical protein n=1 Tax=Stackebrandtia sp. TaxID=2023065 RepID=UPI002D641B5F|nr:hypothetical protein [Stackebrandtia sp.]HZE39323.1 hypothetical protein [Stackebrandtia sp.]
MNDLLRVRREIKRVRKQGPQAIRQVQSERLARLVDHARAKSPYYARLYRGIDGPVTDPARLPVTDKLALMDHFDEWVTDPRVTFDRVEKFTADHDRVGERFLGDYTVVSTSGTTNRRGIFVVDDAALAVNMALSSGLMLSWMGAMGVLKALRRGARMAMVVATEGHLLVNVGAKRMQRGRFGEHVRVLSVHRPLDELVAELNEFRPSIVMAYASTMAMLTAEQEAGRLHIDPVLIQPAGEAVADVMAERMAAAFGATVRDTYGCGECPFLSAGCEHGWYHVNSDWVIAEPVDAQGQPTPPGEPSHTVLLSNLANFTQPILRYDLGDSVLLRPDSCECGNPLPALRVNGRVSEILWLPGAHGRRVAITSLMVSTILPHIDGIDLYQIVQERPNRLRLRVTSAGDAEEARNRGCEALRELAGDQGAADVIVEPDLRPVEQSAGGKYRRIIAWEGAEANDGAA